MTYLYKNRTTGPYIVAADDDVTDRPDILARNGLKVATLGKRVLVTVSCPNDSYDVWKRELLDDAGNVLRLVPDAE